MYAKKRWLTSILLIAGLIGTSAIGPRSQVARADSVNLTFLTIFGQPGFGEFNAAIKVYESSHPGITITQSTVPGTGAATYPNVLRTDIAAGNAPDLFFMWGGTLSGPFVDDGSALDLTPYYQKYGWNKILEPSAVKLITRHGKVWGAPITLNAMTLLYRTDIFSKYGLQVPKTFAQLEGICTTLKSHQIPCVTSGGVYGWYTMRMFDFFLEHTAGPALHDKLLAGTTSWNIPQVVAAFTLLKQWTDNGWFPTGYMGINPTQGEQLFYQGKAAMMLEGDWMISACLTAGLKPSQFSFFNVPTDQKPQRLDGFAQQFMISSQSKHAAEAAAFLNWWIQPSTQVKYYKIMGETATIGGLPSAASDPQGVQYKRMVTSVPNYLVMDQAFPDEFMSTTFFRLQAGVASGSISPQSAAQQMQQGVSKLAM